MALKLVVNRPRNEPGRSFRVSLYTYTLDTEPAVRVVKARETPRVVALWKSSG